MISAVVVPGGGAVAEGDSGTTNLLVPVTLSNPSEQTVTVQWRTASVSGPPPHADPANDFTVTNGVVTFAPGETAKTVAISVKGDTRRRTRRLDPPVVQVRRPTPRWAATGVSVSVSFSTTTDRLVKGTTHG